jgi:uncharacterized protein YqgQ
MVMIEGVQVLLKEFGFLVSLTNELCVACCDTPELE